MIKIVCHALGIALFLSGLMAHSCGSNKADEDVNILSTSMSPDKEYIATFYNVSGGGAAGYAYMLVNLRRNDKPFNPKEGVIFQMTGVYQISLRWDDNEHLTVRHSKPAAIYLQEKEWGNERKIRISYVEES
jgi:hypothetical protein